MNKKVIKPGYEIRIKEHLHACWQEWFDGWEITSLENGEDLLWKSAVDHAELHGILERIRDLNLTLLSVTRSDAPSQYKK